MSFQSFGETLLVNSVNILSRKEDSYKFFCTFASKNKSNL